jgi:prephenate dehydrogenase
MKLSNPVIERDKVRIMELNKRYVRITNFELWGAIKRNERDRALELLKELVELADELSTLMAETKRAEREHSRAVSAKTDARCAAENARLKDRRHGWEQIH